MKTKSNTGSRGLRAALTASFAAAVAMMFAAPAAASTNAPAQQDETRATRSLKVSVSDRKGKPVTGTDVMVGLGGANELLLLDDNGSRTFEVTDDDSIILATSAKIYDLPVADMDSLHVVFRNRNRLGFVLADNGVNREINVGFGTISNRNRTTAVGSLDTSDAGNFIDLKSYINGRIAGVHIQGDQLFIRGNNPLTMGGGEALIVVDGATMSNFSQANANVRPSDVANISVLKDSSAAIYGSQGANGVVLITTKGSGAN